MDQFARCGRSNGLIMPKARSRPTPALFYGYPPDVIASWCHVSESTAYLYKLGQRKPSRQAVRLFILHRDRRVLTDEWKHWLVKADCLVDPEGNETSRELLRNYSLMLQFARVLAEEVRGRKGREQYLRILTGGRS
jgi:hypothetical protein